MDSTVLGTVPRGLLCSLDPDQIIAPFGAFIFDKLNERFIWMNRRAKGRVIGLKCTVNQSLWLLYHHEVSEEQEAFYCFLRIFCILHGEKNFLQYLIA
jgi:hypothetical protein